MVGFTKLPAPSTWILSYLGRRLARDFGGIVASRENGIDIWMLEMFIANHIGANR